MKRIAAAISQGLVPRRSGISSRWRANWSAVCRGLGIVGPGPMPLTRMRGASLASDQLGDIFGCVAGPVIVNRDGETVLGEGERERAADPLCAAGYQGRP